jgi:hypothetical protein
MVRSQLSAFARAAAPLLALVVLVVSSAGNARADDPPAAPFSVEAVRPFQSGDLIWATSPPIALPVSASSGCQRVPTSGYLGTGVYASSSSQYANHWSWGAASSGQPFSWFVKRTDESNADGGSSGGGGGSSQVAANVYHWKVQNQGPTPQAWNVCWDVL